MATTETATITRATTAIEVNAHKVKMPGPATGLEIKESAIKGRQDPVPSSGTRRLKIVGDDDKIPLRAPRVHAIAADDNS